jgi:hypothetical protein
LTFWKRAGGWCEPVNESCESILEQSMERLTASKYFRFQPLSMKVEGEMMPSTRVATRVTLVPVSGTGVFYFYKIINQGGFLYA